MPGLPLDQLETLLAVIDEGSFESAATRLHITPPAVSQRIKALERAAGRVLLRRTLPAAATEAAEPLVRHARRMRLLARELDRELEIEGRTAPSLSVAVNADSLATWFLPALAEAHSRTGAVLEIVRDDQERTAGLLRSGAVVAAVTSEARAVQGCTVSPLGAMRYRAVATPAFVERHLPEGLAGLGVAPRVDFDPQDALQRRFLRTLGARAGGTPRHLVPTSADYASAVALGMGWGLLPDQQSEPGLARGELVELAPDRPVDVALYWQRWNLGSATLDVLTDEVEAAAARALRPLPRADRGRR